MDVTKQGALSAPDPLLGEATLEGLLGCAGRSYLPPNSPGSGAMGFRPSRRGGSGKLTSAGDGLPVAKSSPAVSAIEPSQESEWPMQVLPRTKAALRRSQFRAVGGLVRNRVCI